MRAYGRTGSSMDAKQVARAGVMVALLAVSAQVMVPIGPVPFTLQTFVLAMLVAVLDRGTAMFAVIAYILLGALGLPVFSGFMGGIGALVGPTGGFLWGFVLGTALACGAGRALSKRAGAYPRALVSAAVLLLVSYTCGTAQLMVLMSLDLLDALAIAVLPFVIPDVVKIALGSRVGITVSRRLSRGAQR